MRLPRRNHLVLAALICVWAAAPARANDRVYWTDETLSKIDYAGLDDSGAANFLVSGTSVNEPEGVSLDPAGGRIFWANFQGPSGNRLSAANLDGSGGHNISPGAAPVAGPFGVNFDSTSGRLYWSNLAGAPDSIAFANVDGSGGMTLNTSPATVSNPEGVAVDATAGRVYWANSAGNRISYANLDGSGGRDIDPGAATVASPLGVAVDHAAGRIYWANTGASKISFASVNGGNGGNLSISGATVASPGGVAIDAAANRIYWTNQGPSRGVSFADLTTGVGRNLNAAGIGEADLTFPTLLEAPLATGVPQVSPNGDELDCTPAPWAPDLPEAQLYRAPHSDSLQWSRGGIDIAGATVGVLNAPSAGMYSCRSTAENFAGSSTQTSEVYAKFVIGKLKRNKRKGTARLPVDVPSAGALTLSGRGIVKQARQISAAGTVTLKIKAKGKTRKRLAKRGKAKIAVTIAFSPVSGSSNPQALKVKLVKRR